MVAFFVALNEKANNENVIIRKRDFSLDNSNELKYGYVEGFIQMSC